MRRVDVGEKEPMLILDGLDGLIDLVQAGVSRSIPGDRPSPTWKVRTA